MDNKLIKLWILLMVLIQTSCVFGREVIGLEKLPIPPKIVECNSIAEVKPYLSHKQELMRMWAVRRIGQFGTQEAIQELVAAFDKEPRKTGMETNPYVREEVIHSLGNIGGDGVKGILLGILQKYLDEGPRAKKHAWGDREYMRIVKSTLEELGKWKDEDVLSTFEKTFLDEKLSWSIRETAYGQYLTIKMEKEGIVGFEKTIKYLLDNLEGKGHDWIKGRDGVKTLQAIKDGAIITKLTKYGEAALPYIQQELNKVSPSEEKRRYKGLCYVKKLIDSRSDSEHKEKHVQSAKIDTEQIIKFLEKLWLSGELNGIMTEDEYLNFKKTVVESLK